MSNEYFLAVLIFITILLLLRQIPNLFRPSNSINFESSKPTRTLNEVGPTNDKLATKQPLIIKDLEPKKSPKRNLEAMREGKADGGKIGDLIRQFDASEGSKERDFVRKKLRYETKFDETKQVYKSGSKDDAV